MNYINKIKLTLLMYVLMPLLFGQTEYEKWLQEQQQEMAKIIDQENNYMASVTKEFDQYKKEQEQLLKQFKEEVEKKWDSFRFSSPTEHVDYDKDLNARGSIDFDKGKIEIEILIDDDPSLNKNEREEKAKLKLEKKLKQISTKVAQDKKPILKDQLQTKSGKKITKQNVDKFAKESIQSQKLKLRRIKSKDGKKRIKYTANVYMLPDHLDKRAERFRSEVLKQSKRFNIDPAVAFAIMHTESSFNPNARSHIPAYGLMQLVPSSGARDAYNYVYKRDKVLKGKYLYNPENNIELGCAYIRKLRYEYFKGIKDNQSAYYCTISAYNTGAGNVAKAFTGKTKLKPAVVKINQRNSKQVYQYLLKNLPYNETKKYLRKVTDRVDLYQK